MSLWQESEQMLAENNWEKANSKSKRAYTMAKDEDWNDGILRSLRLLARIAEKQGKPEIVLAYKLDALDYNLKIGDSESIYKSCQELAVLYRTQEIYSKAIQYYNQALSVIDVNNESGTKKHLQELLAETHHLNLRHDSARVYYQYLVDDAISNQQSDSQLFYQQKIADTWAAENKYLQSIAIYEKILQLSELKNDTKNIVTAHNNIGIAYTKNGDYELALKSLKKAEEICGENELVNLSILFSNMGIAHHNLGHKSKAVFYLLKAIKYASNSENQYQLNHTLSKIYLDNKDLYNASFQNNIVHENTKNKKLLSQSYKTGASIEKGLYDFEGALDYYQKHLELEQQFSLENNLENERLLEIKTKLERSEKETRLEMAAQEIEENKIRAEKDRLTLENDKIQLENDKIRLEKETRDKEIALLSQEQKAKEAQILAQEAKLKTKELESETQRQQLALTEQQLQTEMNARELEEAQRQQELQQLELKASQDRETLKQKELEASKMEQEAQAKLLEQEQTLSKVIRTGAFITGAVSLLIIGLVLWFLRLSKRKNNKLARQNNEIEQQRAELEKSRDLIVLEQEKSERLLLNILPEAIAQELKEKGFATPKEYELVTVLFTDFGGFTKVSAQMNPDDLIEELNTCFVAFDNIIEKYGIQPIKTIGDSYMCAGGVPLKNSINPSQMIRAALEINQFMSQRLAEKQAQNIPYWDTRIGLHSGPVIAGVVGKKKFAYDIWGDAVNTASRMESSAEPNTVNISQATYEMVKNDFKCTYRGEFQVKNKGIMKMYQVIQ